MNFNGLRTIFVFILLMAICCGDEAPGYCRGNNISLCKLGGRQRTARAGSNGPCEIYDNERLVEQLNCIRYRSGEPLLEPC